MKACYKSFPELQRQLDLDKCGRRGMSVKLGPMSMPWGRLQNDACTNRGDLFTSGQHIPARMSAGVPPLMSMRRRFPGPGARRGGRTGSANFRPLISPSIQGGMHSSARPKFIPTRPKNLLDHPWQGCAACLGRATGGKWMGRQRPLGRWPEACTPLKTGALLMQRSEQAHFVQQYASGCAADQRCVPAICNH